MKGLVVGDGGALSWSEVPDAEPGPGEVRIRVVGAGLNRADLMQRAGHYPPPPGAPTWLGLECSGVIERVGSGVDEFTVGQPVCALLAGGGCAERVVCPAVQVLPVPDGVLLVQAAGLPEVWATTWMVLEQSAGLAQGDAVLIHGAGGGVGSAMLQWIRHRRGRSFAVAGDDAKLARCRELGAEATWNRHQGSWRDAVAKWEPDGVDIVVDPVGAALLADHQRALAVDGRVVVIGLLGGREATLDFGRLLIRRQRFIGTTLRARPTAQKADILASVREAIWPQIAAGHFEVGVTGVVPLDGIDEAYADMAANTTTGKLVLQIAET